LTKYSKKTILSLLKDSIEDLDINKIKRYQLGIACLLIQGKTLKEINKDYYKID